MGGEYKRKKRWKPRDVNKSYLLEFMLSLDDKIAKDNSWRHAYSADNQWMMKVNLRSV